MIADASKMLKSMMASSPTTTTPSSSTAPTYESIQRQLDELKLRVMKVEKEDSDEEGKGVLLDSGSTHALRGST